MGHSKEYREQQLRNEASSGSTQAQPAWRRIEDLELMRQFRRDLEFFDDSLEGNLEDYLR